MLFERWMCTWDDRLWPFVVFKGNVHRLERPVVATEKIGEEECIPFPALDTTSKTLPKV